MKKLAILFFFIAPFAHAAIAFDASSAGSNSPTFNTTSATWSHTVTGSNTILYVGVLGDTSDSTSGVTYNGVSMTLVDKQLTGAGSRWHYLFYLVNPSTGAHNVVVTNSVNSLIIAEAASYTGVDQATSYGACSSSATCNKATIGSGTSQSVAVTTSADNAWLVGHGTWDTGSIAAGANTTLRQASGVNTGSAYFDSNAPQTPAGSYSLTISGANLTAGTFSGFIVAAMNPSTATPAVAIPQILSFIRSFWITY